MNFDNSLVRFVDYIEFVRNFSDNTIISYTRDLKIFSKYINNNGLDFLNLSRREIEKFIKEFSQGKYSTVKPSSTTTGRVLASIKSFYQFLFINGDINELPTQFVRAPKTRKKLPESLSVNEVQKLLKGFEKRKMDIRNKAIISILYFCGLRVGELCNLELRDVDLINSKLIYIKSGKGNKDRNVPINNNCLNNLLEYKQIRESFIKNKRNVYFFIGARGDKLSNRSVEKMVDNHALKFLPGKKIHPHIFRHSCATHLLQRGVNVKIVQEILGHSNMSTTSIYLHIAGEEKREAINKL